MILRALRQDIVCIRLKCAYHWTWGCMVKLNLIRGYKILPCNKSIARLLTWMCTTGNALNITTYIAVQKRGWCSQGHTQLIDVASLTWNTSKNIISTKTCLLQTLNYGLRRNFLITKHRAYVAISFLLILIPLIF
jgi:hypothetical protein